MTIVACISLTAYLIGLLLSVVLIAAYQWQRDRSSK